MNNWKIATVVAVLLLPAAGAEPDLLLDDPAGDITVEAGPVQHGPVPDPVNHVDLAGLTIVEDQEFFHFEIRFHDAPAVSLNYNELDVYLNHGAQTYRIDMYADAPTGAELHRVDPITGQSSVVGPVEADLSDRTLKKVMVPRGMLLDTDGAPPSPGRTLDGFWVASGSWRVAVHVPDENNFGAWDRMPDEGEGESYEVQHGAHSTGDARLWSPSPARASNGAANTFVFPVVAAHEGDSAATYELRVAQQPDGWDVRIPCDTFRLAAGQQFRFPLMATLPSVHIHDSKESIRLVLDEVGGASEASLELAVVFHSIPQPAGHHPTVYLHSRAGSSAAGAVVPAGDFLYMNALPHDPDDEEVAVHGTANEVGATAYTWTIPLHPSLQMGLDFDMEKSGTLTLPLAADAPIRGAHVSAELVWRQGDDEKILARMAASDPFEVGPASDEHTAVLEWSPEVDLVPYQGLASLALLVRLETDRPVTFTAPEAPKILPGGSLTLPLLEYEDPIDPAFLESPEVELVAVGASERQLNPGRTTTFDLELRTQPGASSAYRIDIAGLNAKWAKAPNHIKITPGQSYGFQVVVEAPEEASSGETADLVVSAIPEDTSDTVLVRLRAVVDGDTDIPDEISSAPGTAKGQNSSLSMVPLATVILVAVAAFTGRRLR